MTNVEILNKAIEIVEKYGYQTPFLENEVLTIPRNAGKQTSIDIWTKGFITQIGFAEAFARYIYEWNENNKTGATWDEFLYGIYYNEWIDENRHQPGYKDYIEIFKKELLITLAISIEPLKVLEKFL